MTGPLWTPDRDRIASSQIERFRQAAEQAAGASIPDTRALHRWSVENLADFWSLVWDDVGVLGDKGEVALVEGASMVDARFFPAARLNFAENLIEGGGRPDDEVAIHYRSEDGSHSSMTRAELREVSAAFASALLELGVEPGDRVAAWMPHQPETIVAMLGSASIGAVFTSTSADFGTAGVIDRLGQVEPVVLIASGGYRYGGAVFDRRAQLVEIRSRLPSVRKVIYVDKLGLEPPGVDDLIGFENWLQPHRGAQARYTRFPFDHPIYVLYSSGTTGPPKCMVHRAGGVLLKHLQEQQHQLDIRAGDTVFYFTTCGWMMWNWLASALGNGASIVLYDGNPFHPGAETLFSMAEDLGVTMFGVSAKYIDAVSKSGLRPADHFDLSSLRTMASTGSPLSPESFDFVYDGISADIHLASISGGTDLCGCFVGGDPTRPVFAGEIQAPALGMAVEVFDFDGRAVRGSQGELVCTAPFPSMPLSFWGADGDARYRAAYFELFPNVWTHGDYAMWSEHGGMVILGRSDATLNAGGVRIGTAEIYRIVEQFPQVAEAVVVAQRVNADTRIVLFVKMADGEELTPDLEAEIVSRLRTEESPRHVPSVITTVQDIPRTRSGKITELAVTAVVNGDPVKNTEALANPDALELYRNRPELRISGA